MAEFGSRWSRVPFILLIVLFVGLWIARSIVSTPPEESVTSYDVIVRAARAGELESVEIDELWVYAVRRGEGPEKERYLVARRIAGADDDRWLNDAIEKKTVVRGAPPAKSPMSSLVWFVLFLLAVPLVLFWLARRAMMGGGGARAMSFGKSKAKLHDRSREIEVTFDDVAGVDEARAELTEVVDFLKNPTRYTSVGARVPKGVLLVGPPGTGKTLLAKATAGESKVPFFSLSGSEFVEMFVGVGASRVRDLFEQAKTRAPCIIFIDELDAIGKTRAGPTGFASNEEREQTLNQLLVEMDGFDSGAGLIIMAATNRPEILDKALMRAGRFDRQVIVDRPDVRGREAILRVHAKKITLGPSVDLRVVAQRTPGAVGADLANIVNEAALAAVRRDAPTVDAEDFEEAIDRIQLGLKKEGRVMTASEKKRIAIHEAGHALVAMTVEHADPVHRITIIPRSIGALGATLQLPTEDRYVVTRDELMDKLAVLMGGRAAEQFVCNDASTGAQNDLERATEIARQMVCRFGMSERAGLQVLAGEDGLRWLPGEGIGQAGRALSESTRALIDAEIRRHVDESYERAAQVIESRRADLARLTEELLSKETLDRDDLHRLFGGADAEGETKSTPHAPTSAPQRAGVTEGEPSRTARSKDPSAEDPSTEDSSARAESS